MIRGVYLQLRRTLFCLVLTHSYLGGRGQEDEVPGRAKQLGISRGTGANLFGCPTAGSHYIIGLSTPLSLPRVQCPKRLKRTVDSLSSGSLTGRSHYGPALPPNVYPKGLSEASDRESFTPGSSLKQRTSPGLKGSSR